LTFTDNLQVMGTLHTVKEGFGSYGAIDG
jgi:hypothetical protein